MTFEKADQDALVRDAWAKVFYSRDVDLGRRNWDDMGGGEPSDERIEWELALDPLLSALIAQHYRADRAEARLATVSSTVEKFAARKYDAQVQMHGDPEYWRGAEHAQDYIVHRVRTALVEAEATA